MCCCSFVVSNETLVVEFLMKKLLSDTLNCFVYQTNRTEPQHKIKSVINYYKFHEAAFKPRTMRYNMHSTKKELNCIKLRYLFTLVLSTHSKFPYDLTVLLQGLNAA